MNIERLTQIAEWLEAGAPHRGGVAGFDMRYVTSTTDCGTVCCIAGAANAFFDAHLGMSVNAARRLGINRMQSLELFMPDGYTLEGKYSAAHAARCIRKLIATGEVDWHGTEHMPDVRATDQENPGLQTAPGLATEPRDDRVGTEDAAGRGPDAGSRVLQGLLDRCQRPERGEAGLDRDVEELDTAVEA